MKSTLPSFIGISVVIAGIAVGVFFIQQQQIFRLRASPEKTPKDVRITNVSDTSLTISWYTDAPTNGFVEWGESESLGKTAQDNLGSSYTHSLTLHNLTTSTNYFFKINSGGIDFLNEGSPWQTTTAQTLTLPQATFASGKIIDSDGQPVAQALVYVTIASNLTQLSTITTSSGDWLVPISIARTTDLSEYANLENASIEIFVRKEPQVIANAKIKATSANPTPSITLGKTHDFTNVVNEEIAASPETTLNLPITTQSSRFEVSDSASDEQKTLLTESEVTVENIEEDEVIFTTKPEFFGSGPAGETLTITLQSDPITEQVTVPTSGEWNWTPPADLEEGEHTITVTWRDDISGILRSLTKTFVVEASNGDPAFETTPSATPTPKPSPTATPPASPSATPRVSVPATDSAIPVSGVLTPTYLLVILGIILTFLGLYFSLFMN